MAAGPTQIIHTVNSGFAVFDKANGAMTFRRPYNITALWQVSGQLSLYRLHRSANTNVSMADPVVSYDQFAQRWLITISRFVQRSMAQNCAVLSLRRVLEHC